MIVDVIATVRVRLMGASSVGSAEETARQLLENHLDNMSGAPCVAYCTMKNLSGTELKDPASCAKCGTVFDRSEAVTDTDTDGKEWIYCSRWCEERH